MSEEPAITYFNMGQWPLFVGFTMSPKAYRKEVARLKVDKPDPFVIAGTSATVHTFLKDGDTVCLINLQKAKRSVEQLAGILAHEAVHVAQRLWDAIGEEKPGREAEAYLVQQITQCCLQEALKTGRTQKAAP